MMLITARLCALIALLVALASCSAGDRADPPVAPDPLVDTEWVLIEMAGTEADAEPPVSIRFQSDAGITGRSFVNQYFAQFATAPEFEIGQIGATRMAGPPELMERERMYFELLQFADGFTLSDDTLTVFRDGDAVLRFKRQ